LGAPASRAARTAAASLSRRPCSIADRLADVRRNFLVFQPLDFLGELFQHIPNKGEHLIRYYGYYSNKARGTRRGEGIPPLRVGGVSPAPVATVCSDNAQDLSRPQALARRRWAMLIKHVYQVIKHVYQADQLLCPVCGGTMKIISFIEARQGDVIRKILQHCCLWQDSPTRAPPPILDLFPKPQTGAPLLDPDSGLTREPNPDFAEHLRREEIDGAQPQPPWDD